MHLGNRTYCMFHLYHGVVTCLSDGTVKSLTLEFEPASNTSTTNDLLGSASTMPFALSIA